MHKAVHQTWGEVVALLRNHWIITLFNDAWKQNAIGKKSSLDIDCVLVMQNGAFLSVPQTHHGHLCEPETEGRWQKVTN